MAIETIYYKVRDGINTKDPLREIAEADINWLKTVFTGYQILAEWDPRPEFKQWFMMANDLLPRQPQRNNERNSPQSFSEGICDKLNQARHRRDLSPKQCDAIEALSKQMSEIYDIPEIVFKDKVYKQTPATETNFTEIFKSLKKR